MARRAQRPKHMTATGKTTAPIVNRYDAAGYGRRMRGWVAPPSGPNRAIDGLHILRDRARDAVRNEWAGASGARVWTTNLIGTGIVPRPKTQDAALKARLVALWDTWVPQADADGVLDFYGQQTLATRSWVASGEVFIRFRWRRPEDGLAVPLQIQLLESDMVPQLDVDSWPGMQTGNVIRSGIELDRIGRRVAYWMYKTHPGDRYLRGALASLDNLTRVPAEQMRHLYEPIRPGQLRGVSDFAPILAKLRGVMDFDDAVLERQKLANLFTLFITRAVGGDPNINPVTGLPTNQFDQNGAPLAALEPGISQELLPGEDVKFSDPPDAGANYADFSRWQHLGISAGMGTPSELLTGDLKDVSDRTLRVIINEFHRHCEQRQWQIVIPLFCQPVRDAWADAAALAGVITTAESADARRVTWQPHGWAYLHPVQDAQGKRVEVDAGFRSRSSVIAERGEDPDAVDAERAADMARDQELGLVELVTPPPVNSSAVEAREELREIRAILNGVQSNGERQHVIHVGSPVVNLGDTTVQIPDTVVNVAAPVVNVGETHVHVPDAPAPVVHVAAPEVHFEAVMPDAPAPVIHVTNEVQPAAVDVNVNLPVRKTETTIVRDAKGDITRATQLETNA